MNDNAKFVCSVSNKENSRISLGDKGEAFTEARWQEAFLQEVGIKPSNTSTELGELVPRAVLDRLSVELARRAAIVAEHVTKNWNNVAAEAELVSMMLTELHASFVIEEWSVSLRPQVFSSIRKEPQIGADMGWLVQISVGRRRLVKALWMQAKRTPYDVADSNTMFRLTDFRAQFGKMKARTHAAYGIVFTPDRIVVGNDSGLTTLHTLLVETVSCRAGDRRPEIVVETIDRHYVAVLDLKGTVPRRKKRSQQRSRDDEMKER